MKKRLRKKKHLGGLGKAADECGARIRGIRAWLDARGDIAAYRVGPEFDLWQDDCREPSPAEGALVAVQETAR